MFRRMLSRCRSAGFYALLLVCMFWVAPAWSELAQEPLLSRTVNVRPNILMVLDTSGSMAWGCVYSAAVTDLLRNEATSPSRIQGLTIDCVDKDDPRQLSPVNNLLYYNPGKTYSPGYTAGVKAAPAPPYNEGLTVFMPNSTPLTGIALKDKSKYTRYEVRTDNFYVNGVKTDENPFGARQRKDCVGAVCTFQEERQNIANWKKSHATRMLAAQTGLSAAFSNQPDNFRLAWGDIYIASTPPEWYKAKTKLSTMENYGTAKAKFFQWLDGLSAGGGTPLVLALEEAGKYYSNASSSGPWATSPTSGRSEVASSFLACRKSNTLLITDGFWNGYSGTVGNADGTVGQKIVGEGNPQPTFIYDPASLAMKGKKDTASNTLADVALKYWASDLQPGMKNIPLTKDDGQPFWQNMTSYMVSFGAAGSMSEKEVADAKKGEFSWVVPESDKLTTIDDMRHAAHNGGGDFLTVTDAEQFSTQIGRVIGKMASQKVSQAGVAGSSVVSEKDARKVRTIYVSGNWWGNLELVALEANGDEKKILWSVIEVKDGAPTGATLLPAPAERKIAVWADSKQGAIDFTHANVSASVNGLTGSSTNFQMRSGVSKELIEFLRGERAQEGPLFRRRLAVLGDIVNATPAYVKKVFKNPGYEKLPAGSAGLDTYAAYMAAKNARSEGAIFVGANDGMLHVFREGEGDDAKDGGREIFAYIPRSVLGKLEALAAPSYLDAHSFTVDGPLTEVDAYVSIGKKRPAWRNLVIGTTGAGAKAVFALDATDPLSVSKESVLWEINPDPQFPVVANNAGNAFQEIGHVLSKVESGVTASGHWVAVFGNGYDSKSGRASLFIVDSGNGALLKEIKTDARTNNGLGGVRLVLDGKHQIIGAYAGDLQGRLWKFDLSGQLGDWALANSGKPLFTAMAEKSGEPLPITAVPSATVRTTSGYPLGYMVSFVTGKLLESRDMDTTTPVQAIFGVWDRKPFGVTGTDDFTDAQLERLKLIKKDASGGDATYSVEFVNPATKAIDWNVMRGWRTAMDTDPGMRGYGSINTEGDVILVSTVIPPSQAVNCESALGKGAVLPIDPTTGQCRVGGTLDTNGDDKVDEKDDASVCGFSTGVDGIGFAMVVLDGSGEDSGLRNGQGGYGKKLLRVKNPAKQGCTNIAFAKDNPSICTGCASASYRSTNPGACVTSRSWRQIYPRAR